MVGVPRSSSHKASAVIFCVFGQFIIGILLFVICIGQCMGSLPALFDIKMAFVSMRVSSRILDLDH